MESGDLGGLRSDKVNLKDPTYWNREALDQEMRRQFDICHGCRMCVGYCPSFPKLFKFVDNYDGEAEKLTHSEMGRVMDLCFNCKLCFVKCPYTPPHELLIDIPKLVQRYRAVEAQKHLPTLRGNLMDNPEAMGKLAAPLASLVNFGNKSSAGRQVIELIAGVDHRAILPNFHRETFQSWYKKHAAARTAKAKTDPVGKVALFYTCVVNYNAPQVGKALVEVLEHNGFKVACPEQSCCGMPMLDSGDVDKALDHMRRNVASMIKWVKAGYDIIIPEPTCGMMFKKEYKDYLDGEAVAEVAAHSYDISEYLFRQKRAGKLKTDFVKAPGKLAYHQPCHLKYQAIGRRSFDLLKLLPGAEVTFVDKGCSGHSGSWGVKKENYDLSMQVGAPLFKAIKELGDVQPVTDCTLAGLSIQQGTGLRPIHPVEVLYRAYGLDQKKEAK
ncbi:MAG: anaerobic glycerol-3-phosphate dehydrogenase subunit C [Chloroflexota bacterium]|nr:anaerobic glycerol-3-phosphate dehydrogenase subunit C [Chloroflexota bacterium]